MLSRLKITVFLIVAGGLCFFPLYLTDWLFNPKGFNFLKYAFRALLLICSVIFFWKSILLIVSNSKNEIFKNALSFTGVIFSLIIFLEICSSFVLLSAGGEKTLVGKNWFNYYWQVNEFGYRDQSPKETDRIDKKNIFVVGDSYVAGHGLKKEDQRFSNILRSEFKNCFDVFNLGVCGADTKEEFEFLSSYPCKPDLIILSYVNNDIYKILDKKDIYKILKINPGKDNNLRRYTSTSGYLFSHSFLFNFIDLLLFEKMRDQELASLLNKYPTPEQLFESEEGKAVELSYYKNDSLMKLQLNNIDKFIQYSTSNNVELLVVLFPLSHPRVIDYTDKTANEPITEYLKQKGVQVINFTSRLKRIPNANKHVNQFDPHPGIYTNAIIADTIAEHMAVTGLLDKLCH